MGRFFSDKSNSQKVHLARFFIAQYYRDFWMYLRDRKKRSASPPYLPLSSDWYRMAALRETIGQGNMTPEQARALEAEAFSKETAFLRVRRTRLSLDNFKVYARLGKGSFAEVCGWLTGCVNYALSDRYCWHGMYERVSLLP